MGKASKATKKFQKKHLKHTIEHRKEIQKHNKKVSSHKKSKNAGEDGASGNPKNSKNKEVFDDLSIDEFFESDFKVPKDTKSKKVKQDTNDSSSSDEEDEMEEDIDALAQKDPEFYSYLKENDPELLDFKPVDPLDAVSDDDSQDEEGAASLEEGSKVEEENKSKIEITLELINSWNQKLNKPTTSLIRNICIAYKAAVNINLNEDEDYKYSITDPVVFDQLTSLALKKVPEAIQKLVKYKVNKQTGVRSIPQNNPNVSQISSILKSHVGSYITLLKDINNTETAAFVLSSLQEIFPFFISYRKVLKQILLAVLHIWTTAQDIETQIAAFAFINNVTKEFSKSILELALRNVYSVFLQNCRNTNIHTMERLNFCKNSAAELFLINEEISYQVGFEYIRQLAMHLRNSMNQTSNAKEGFKIIYNWQYCHALDFWSRLVSQSCNPERELSDKKKESQMRQLIYPLVQVTIGAIRLIPTAQFFPLRFYLIRSLIRISRSTGVYIPVFPLISEVLSSKAITRASKNSQLVAFDFEHSIKANQAYIGTKVYLSGLCEQFIDLTSDFFVLYCKSIAFPELVTPAIITLRRFIKASKNARFNKQLQQLVEKLNSTATFIESKRSSVEFSASNRAEVQMFLKDLDWEKTPLGQFVVVQRQIREAKLKALQEAAMESNNAVSANSDLELSAEEENSE